MTPEKSMPQKSNCDSQEKYPYVRVDTIVPITKYSFFRCGPAFYGKKKTHNDIKCEKEAKVIGIVDTSPHSLMYEHYLWIYNIHIMVWMYLFIFSLSVHGCSIVCVCVCIYVCVFVCLCLQLYISLSWRVMDTNENICFFFLKAAWHLSFFQWSHKHFAKNECTDYEICFGIMWMISVRMN